MEPTMTVKEGGPPNPNFGPEDDIWTCTLRYNGRRMTIPYYMGPGLNGAKPDVWRVLESLALDASGYEDARDFEDWCGEYGYDTDSRSAERTYKAVARSTRKLHALLGDDFTRITQRAIEGA